MRRPAATPVVLAAMAAFAVGYAALSVLRRRAFVTGRFDLGNMVQAVWSTAHGHPLQMTNLHGAQSSRLAAHVDPILALFGPLWWIWPSPDLLLVVQAAALATGAWAVFLLARKHLASARAALGFALAYLLYPATGWLTLNEFHPVALATPLLLFAFWYLDDNRLLPFALCAVAAAACKEEIGLVVAGMGAWYALSHRRWAAGAAIVALGIAWSAIAIGIVIPHYHATGESDFYGRYSEVGGSAPGIVKTTLTDPGRIFDAAFSTRDLRYLLELVAPLAALCLLAPLVLIAALPELAINLLSATPTQTSIHFHYTAGLIPPLVVAAVLGAKRLNRRTTPVAAAVVIAAVLGNYLLGPIPGWRHVPGGEHYQATAARVTEHDRIAARALALIPKSAVVSATNTLGAHLSARKRVLSFPFIQDATWIAADETQPGYADRYAPVPTAIQLAELRRNSDWRLVFEQDGVLIFNRPQA
ncbi:MAG: DUF2079 domain-containing protein [Gaiellaceae bacterium]